MLLNYPDDDDDEIEKLRDKRNKEMEQLISEKVYEETLSKEKACIQWRVMSSSLDSFFFHLKYLSSLIP